MQQSLNKVIRYKGSKQKWNEHIANGEWNDCIVFGQVEDPVLGLQRLVYAGKDNSPLDDNPYYTFESLEDLVWNNEINETIL